MCGIAGFWTTGAHRDDANEIARSMADRIANRGPDDRGEWSDAESGIAIAHRRLSIVDLSAAGHQPMLSSSGRWVLAYNGEIYNHLDLRYSLEAEGGAPPWRGHSDTETLLAAVEAWGVDEALKRSVGMFAFALWDRRERTLLLARDRIGEKPLYYGWQGDAFLFGSELAALRAHPAFKATVDRGALALLLRHNHVPGPYSIYAGILKLPPGTWLKLGVGQRDVHPVAWWSLAELAERGVANPFSGSEDDAVDALERHLGNSVRGQMVADVPLGALLSGGIDSSLVVALMQANSSRPVRTYTIGFEEKDHDETVHAREVAAHLGTEHSELRLSANDALALIPRIPQIYDEPFADASQLPTHLVMKLARQHVTVALSGDAGDEFFGGYNRYVFGPRVWRRIGWMPSTVRRGLGVALTAMPASAINRALGRIASSAGIALPGDKAHKLGRCMRDVASIDDLYVELVSEWPDAANMVVDGFIPPNLLDQRNDWPRLADSVGRMMVLDGLTYLPDDILVKVDRAAMAISLETRVPFLDRDVMAFAWSLPMTMKLQNGRGKWILRRLLDRYVPRKLIDRPKAGFAIPLDAWLRGPLREWAENLLGEDRLRREGYLDPKPIREAWTRHVRGHANLGNRLWSVLMFQTWLEEQGRGA
jgi:asparagine synthase (glutamine-hydrolysing)